MHDAFWDDEPLMRLKIDRPIFQVDDEVTLQHKEELIVVVVFVPMILALHNAEAND